MGSPIQVSPLVSAPVGVQYTSSSPVSVTNDGADNVTVMRIMMFSLDLSLSREQAEEQAGTLVY